MYPGGDLTSNSSEKNINRKLIVIGVVFHQLIQKLRKMSGVRWTTEPNGLLEITVGQQGFAAKIPKTIIEVFRETVKKHGHRNALYLKRAVNVSNATFFRSIVIRIVYWLKYN